MEKTCNHCGNPIERGSGSHLAKLCVPCWAQLIVRVQRGEQQKLLADEYGVSRGQVSSKVATYGQD
jgi:hypothetical protein